MFIRAISVGLLLATRCLISQQQVGAQCSSKSSDSSFPGVTISPTFPQIVEYDITRVVSSDTDANGRLLNPAQDIQNGLVGPKAYLSYNGVGDINGFPFGKVISFYVNGVQVAQRPIPLIEFTQIADCIPIDIQNIKFAQRVAGQAPTPGANIVTVKYDGVDVSEQFVFLALSRNSNGGPFHAALRKAMNSVLVAAMR